MCGICGFQGRPNPAVLAAMLSRLEHRGPDDEGVNVTTAASIGVRRLAIIDPEGGHQPALSEDGRVAAVLNGEIYNYRELRAMLARRGHRFRSSSDTEVLPHLYEEFGVAMMTLVEGMFAFAVWDEDEQRLLLARDRMGEKPLLYADVGGRLVFASELRALLAHPEVHAELDPAALRRYLTFQYVPGPGSILAGVRKLPPGHRLVAEGPVHRVERYWDVAPASTIAGQSFTGAVAELRGLLETAVTEQVHADVPVGALLSGGIDSSGIAALMSRVGNGDPLRTFTVGFDVPGYDEREPARRVARALGCQHTEVAVGPPTLELLTEVAMAMDEPVADQAALPTFLVCRVASEHVTVVLTGEGADELFGGYPRYRWLELASRLHRFPPALRRRLIGVLDPLLPDHRRRQLDLLLASRDPLGRHLAWTEVFGGQLLRELLEPDVAGDATAEGLAHLGSLLDGWADAPDVEQSMYLDLKTWLVDDILTKADRMSMASSIEARAPYLDRRVVELATSLPASLRLRDERLGFGSTKAVLRAALAGFLPPEALARRKQAFQVPFAHWLAGRFLGEIRELLLASDAATRPFLRPDILERLLRRPDGADSRRIWTLLVLELWMRHMVSPPAADRSLAAG